MKRSLILALAMLLAACGARSDAEGPMPSASKSPLDVVFLPGMRQDISPRLAPAGTLIRAENVRFGRRGGIFPRPGSSSIGTTTDTAGHTISADIGWIDRVGDVGLVGSGGKAFAYDETSARFRLQGLYATAKPVRRRDGMSGTAANFFGARRYGMATTTNGYTMLAASDGTSISYFIEDANGTRLLEGAAAGTKTAVLGVGATFVLIYQNATNVSAMVITPGTSVAFGSPALVGTLNASSSYWDATAATNGTEWYLAHQSGGTTMRLDRFSGITSQANNGITVAGTCPVSLYQDATALWVGLYNDPTVSGNVRVYTRSTTAVTAVAGPFTIASAANTLGVPLLGSSGTAGTVFFVYRRTGANGNPPHATEFGTVTSAGTVTGPLHTWGAVPITKPGRNRDAWVMLNDYRSPGTLTGGVTQIGEQRAALIRWPEMAQAVPATVELSGPAFATHVDVPVGLSGGPFNYDYFSEIAHGASTTLVALPRILDSDASAQRIGLEVFEYETVTQSAGRSTVTTGLAAIVSGQPVEIPGLSTSNRSTHPGALADALSSGALELGFPVRPRILTAVQSAGGGSRLTLLGSYSWIAVWEMVDDFGRIHRSQPSAPVTLDLTGSNDTVTITATGLGFTQRQSFNRLSSPRVELVLYRTTAFGSVYQRVTNPGLLSAWDDTDGTISYPDSLSDAGLDGRPYLYTDGGVKDNALAPACRVVFETDERLACALGWERDIVTVSKIVVPGEPPQFTDDDGFRIFFPEPLSAAAFLDGALVGWSSDAIYIVSGDGPNDQGIGAFSSPRAIARGLGATSEVVLVTELGAMFFNARGWWLLPRGFGSPVFVGGAVQDVTRTYSEPLSGTVHVDSQSRTAQLLMRDPDTGLTLALVMDLDVRTPDGMPAWSLDQYGGVLTAAGPWPRGMLSAGASTSQLYHFDAADPEATDAGSTEPIVTLIETADLRPFGVAGWGRVMSFTLLASDTDGAPTLSLRCTPDDATASGVTGYSERTWTLSAGSGSVYRQVVCANVQGTAWRALVTVERTNSLGPVLHGLTLDLNQETGARRLAAGER